MNERQVALPDQGNKRMPPQAATHRGNTLDCGTVNFALFCARVLGAQKLILPVSLSAGGFPLPLFAIWKAMILIQEAH